MKKRAVSFVSDSDYQYVYSYGLECFVLTPPALDVWINPKGKPTTNGEEADYYKRKYEFLQENGFLEEEHEVSFVTNPNPELIKKKLANLRQLLFEVTDGCNLKCKYCGYGDLYDNYDKRSHSNLTFKKAKHTIDYMFRLWRSELNTSQHNVVNVSFYGGEPLMNMPLIKQIIGYLEENQIAGTTYSYRMTTNGLLLNRFMDFLVEKNFSLLISLDGNKENNGYRVTLKGENSFDIVFSNICMLKEKYSDYYSRKVNYNAVLHDKNSVSEILQFIKSSLLKTPKISELTPNGIKTERVEEFKAMYNSKQQSLNNLKEIDNCKEITDNPYFDLINALINGFLGNTFRSHGDLLRKEQTFTYVPTGTCIAFHKKMFITVNGKILPCEKVGQSHPLGHVTDEDIEIDYENISKVYDAMYSPLIQMCKNCYLQRHCGQCVFHIYDASLKGIPLCPSFTNRENISKYMSRRVSVLETTPMLYNEAFKTQIID